MEYLVGDLTVLPAQRLVLRGGQPVGLGARAFDLLVTLLEHCDRVVGKDELLALAWPGLVVEENNLSVQISTLRKVLGKEAITTIAARGYRLTAPVSKTRSGDPQASLINAPARTDEPEFPAQQARDGARLPGAVPTPLGTMVGRAQTLQDILALMKRNRCLSLTGAGGSGKTRLALELATLVRRDYLGGVWWIELANLRDATMLLATIAQTLGQVDPAKSALQNVSSRLQDARVLLVLDNCEHLIEQAAQCAVQLLQTLPQLHLLTTSRESLRIAGEVVWPVDPLEVPSAEADHAVHDLERLASVQLLVERIRQHSPKFAVTASNAASLARTCRAMDGLPLALELIAARVGVQTLEQIADHLGNALPLMTGGQRGGLRHHQTMAAAVQWSYDLLNPSEQSLFLRLSPFAGGWSLDAAQALFEAGKSGRSGNEDLFEVLGQLERVSLVRAHEVDGVMRFRMLEPVRQFAFEKLTAQGLAQQAQQDILAWCANWCSGIAAELNGPRQAHGYKALAAEIDNLLAVLAWSKDTNPEQGLLMASQLWRLWQVKGHAKAVLAWFEDMLPRGEHVSAPTRADAYNAAGVMARTCGQFDDALRLHGASLALQRSLGNQRGEAVALNNLAVVARDMEDHAVVERHCRASMKIARKIGDKNLEGLGLLHLGTALLGQGQTDAAAEHFTASFAIFTQLGEQRVLANLHNFLGKVALAKGDLIKARNCFERSLGMNEELADYWGIALSSCNLARLHYELGDYPGALTSLLHSLAHYRKAGVKQGLQECFEMLAQIALVQSLFERAAWCWGVLGRFEQDTGKPVSSAYKARRKRALAELTTHVSAPTLADREAAGGRLRIEEALGVVLAEHGL